MKKKNNRDGKRLMLYPNCSEVTYKLVIREEAAGRILIAFKNKNYEQKVTIRDDGSSDILRDFYNKLKEMQKDKINVNNVEIKLIKEGQGSWECVKKCFIRAKVLALDGKRYSKKFLQDEENKIDDEEQIKEAELYPNCSETTFRLDWKLDFSKARSPAGKILNSLSENNGKEKDFYIEEMDGNEVEMADEIMKEKAKDPDLNINKIGIKDYEECEGESQGGENTGCDYNKNDVNEWLEDAKQKAKEELELLDEKEILNPNCSEIVWRLRLPPKTNVDKVLRGLKPPIDKQKKFGTWTDNFPNDCLDTILAKLKGTNPEKVDEAEICYVDNSGGGGNWEFVEECFKIAKRYIKGEITLEQAQKLEKDLWNDDGEYKDFYK